MHLQKAARIIFIGAPGVGKGTQAARLLRRFPQLSSVSSGDLLREQASSQTDLGKEMAAALASGQFVPDSLVLRLILAEFKKRGWLRAPDDNKIILADSSTPPSKNLDSTVKSSGILDAVSTHISDDASSSFILDGFPRTVSQAQHLDELIPINLVISIKTPSSKILERIEGRWIHSPSGRTYNTTFKRPKIDGKDDVTSETLTKRPDDDIETWKRRLKQFEDVSKPLLAHYARKGILWEVEGDNSDDITPQIFLKIEERFGTILQEEIPDD